MILIAACSPLVTGVIQKLKARLQCRSGASVVQPYHDLMKLLRKGTVQSDTASGMFRVLPALVLAATLVAATLVPAVWVPEDRAAAQLPLGDAIVLTGLLALARFLTAIGALDAGGAFGGMGASREMTVGVLVEPVLMLVVFSVALAGGTTDLGRLATHRLAVPSFHAPDLLALLAMLVLLLAETGRIPVDNPDTHLELTMLHEGMLLEHSGPGLACMVLAGHLKQLVMISLVAAIFLPIGLATQLAPYAIALALAAFAAKVLVLSVFLALVESSYAKLRFFRLPQFLGVGFVTGFLALSLRIL
ncbi:MAG: formate hydrogenlyase [Deltaproteobacteria bacterium]|nr:MAG: formate hydrogenlyase [Deltaproteobacteria bacterium]TMQ27623.1 MAG: formate hydrogenlyase [Deltaproteobacteria bacterium]